MPAPEEGAQGLLLASDPLRIRVSEVRRGRALLLACRMGNLEQVKESMRKAEDLLVQDLSGEIPLAAAYWSLCASVPGKMRQFF